MTSATSATSATSDRFAQLLRSRTSGEVRADPGHRALYAADASNHRVVPRCVTFPRSVDDVLATIELCAAEGVPLTSRGGGTGIAGGALGSGVVVDLSRHLDRVLHVDPEQRTAVVQPGVVLDSLQRQAAVHGLRFGPDPSSHDRCTVGGMVATNACGSHSVAWGTTADSVRSLQVALADGRTVWLGGDRTDPALAGQLAALGDHYAPQISTELGRFRRQVSGYALQHLRPEDRLDAARAFVGSEGTCGLVTEISVDLVPVPAHRLLVIAGFTDLVAAAAAAPELARRGTLTVEGMGEDVVGIFDARRGPHSRPPLPQGRAWLLVEVGADTDANAQERASTASALAAEQGAVDTLVVADPRQQRAMWVIREKGAGLASRTADGREAWAGWEDAAVPPENLADYLSGFDALLAGHGRRGVVYGHFGEGCVHVRIDHDLLSAAGRSAYQRFQQDAAALVVAHRGSLSGEHGDGRTRSGLLATMYSPRMLEAFAAFKHAFDPGNVFNPGVLVDPVPFDADLRAAVSRPHTREVRGTTHLAFAYADDDGDFAKATRRCVGVGACRKDAGGGMCPSYRATRDEQHSTRGRARLLFEMLDGELAGEGWRSDAVDEALDLCLACKACSNECPVSVDMATYKAEFLHQRYRRRLRPLTHYSMGWLPVWLRAARWLPRAANAVLGRRLARRAAGIDIRRSLPAVARDRAVVPRRADASAPPPHTQRGGAQPVVLWADTFTATFAPEVLDDAVAVLESAGFGVTVVGPDRCCGLTWVSTGQLGVARRVLARTVRALAQTAGPVVVLEPSCAATLRGDAPDLLATDEAREVAERVRTLGQLLRDLPLDLAAVDGPAVVQFHCHQRAVLGTDADRELLDRLGVRVTSVDEGCCGLAGNFGMERGHYDVSVTCAEQSFLPVLEQAADDVPVLADGFSCRLQIQQLAGRQPVHLAQLLRRQLTGTATRR
ncbi:MAG: FAD-binding oxidoreductase [Actinomycetota bacterium]|nr:FAD-binding oxidoreductase [Actinomycetota bacterium]